MRTIQSALAAHLGGAATTLCICWRVVTRDGAALGFTEHDHDLTVAATQYWAASGFAASDGEEAAGLPASTSNVAGGFSHEAITEADLAAGRYDGARVEVYLVNWADPEQHLLLKVQEIGEVTRQAGQFEAELRSFAARLAEPQGRVYNRRCDAALGDARCGVDLTLPRYRAEATVAAVSNSTRLRLSGAVSPAAGFFAEGRLRFFDGENAGLAVDIDSCAVEAGLVEITLWLPLAQAPAVGDRVTLTAGCDKSFSTCRAKFANASNFRGFPHMPGADFAYGYADGTSRHDGSPLFS
ncbi:DUF2163 domain-containing protein [Rhizobium sp. RAF56]|uniref:DUF2163 domain-containing protein n=1 Tax=Rhizobium sp. RAF56 TaxID=3233062 RepID=UPI003F9B4370